MAQLKKSAADLQKGIAQAERERRAVEARLAQLGQDLAGLEAGAQEAGAACGALREAQVAARAEVEALGLERYKVRACMHVCMCAYLDWGVGAVIG